MGSALVRAFNRKERQDKAKDAKKCHAFAIFAVKRFSYAKKSDLNFCELLDANV
jgi:hypothetical protein